MSVLIEPGTEFPSVRTVDPAEGREFVVVLEPGDSGWGAYVPDLPGVVAAADTEAGVRQLIEEAVQFHLDGLRDEQQPIPLPRSRVAWVPA
jgi:predicted RNase H-like HicB family nuclease